jgi:hypothetical protein
VRRRENKKPTFGSLAEVGFVRFDQSFPYRSISPHSSALLLQQQIHAPIMILWFTGHFL